MSGPDVVARPGRIALMISTSALALYSSDMKNAHSSAITATYVGPRRRRKEAARQSMLTPLSSSMVSAVRRTTSCLRIGKSSKLAEM